MNSNLYKFFSLFLLIFFSSYSQLEAQETIDGTLSHDGIEREYILYVPENYTGDEAVPLVFNFHGYTSTAYQQMLYGNFRPIADTAGFLIVHPMGTLDNTGTPHFNVGWGGSTTDDIGFSEALLDEISSNYNINLDRVYSTGMSNGGFMSYNLACNLSDKIAAIASVTGSMTSSMASNCDPQHPTPILQIHGTADLVVPYNGSNIAEPIDDVIDYWVGYNNNDPNPTIIEIDNTNITDLSTVTHYIYSGGDNGANTELFKVTNGGHTWPGTPVNFPGTNYDIDASLEIWKFFSRYDINGELNPTNDKEVDIDKLGIKVFPNPTSDFLIIESNGLNEFEYHFTTIAGKVLKTGIINSSNFQLDVSQFPNGMYLFQVGGSAKKVFIQ